MFTFQEGILDLADSASGVWIGQNVHIIHFHAGGEYLGIYVRKGEVGKYSTSGLEVYHKNNHMTSLMGP